MTVYFLQAGDVAVKIGFTAGSPQLRLSKVKSDCPIPVTLLGAIPGTEFDELALQKRVWTHRIHGDWFRPHHEVSELVAAQLALHGGWKKPKKPAKHSHPLCAYRAENGITLDAMAGITGISVPMLSMIESGQRPVGVRYLARITGATKIPAKVLRPDLYEFMREGISA